MSSDWWQQPRLKGYTSLFPRRIVDLIARSFAIVESGGLSGIGPERGRNFERLFYELCDSRRIALVERAGSRTSFGQRSASGLGHELDATTAGSDLLTQWELKHLSVALQKNELLIFNGKGLDFLQGSSRRLAKIPIHRFLLSGRPVRDECRLFAILWGISAIEPYWLPLPLIYEASVRGANSVLSRADFEAVVDLASWACRPLQKTVAEISSWSNLNVRIAKCGPKANSIAREVMDLQEQIGRDVRDYLDEEFPDWVDNLASHTWIKVGGW